ncbi:MAG TPA: GntR family transcriptional regulator [Tianweitania sediminis]|nr:GntR family transcriptional regulator [Tianweitania sediminis]
MTVYGRLANEFTAKILSGEWPVGTKLPTVAELSRMYQVAPVTIRGALALLNEQGMLHSRQGRGTFVLQQATREDEPDLEDAYFDSWIVGPSERVEVLERHDNAFVPDDLSDGAPLYANYVQLRRLHQGKQRPVCLVDFYFAREAYDSLPAGIDGQFKVGLLLMTKAEPRPKTGRQITTVTSAGSEDALLLEIPAASPIVRVDRRFLDAEGRVLGAGVHRYPGAVFKQVIDQPIDEILGNMSGWLPSR